MIYKILSDEEKKEKLKKAKKGDKSARNDLIYSFMPLAAKLSHSFEGLGVESEDLTQSAVEGIINALNKFDEKKGALTPYVAQWIKSSMIAEIHRNGSAIKIPDSTRRDIRKLDRIITSLEASGITPTLNRLASESGWSLKKVKKIFKMKETLALSSLDTALNGDESDSKAAMIESDAPAVDYSLESDALKSCIKEGLDLLSDTERRVILLHFGIDCEPKSYDFINKMLHISNAQKYYIEALKKLRSDGDFLKKLRDFY